MLSVVDMAGDGIQRRHFLHGAATAGVIGLTSTTTGAQETTTEGGGGQQLSLRVGTSAGGTRDVGLAVERAVSQHSDALDYSTIESPGYIGTIFRMAQGQFNAGITDNNSLTKAMDDRGRFSEQSVDQVPYYGFYAFPYSIYVVARDGTGIETFDDLAGANVYPAEPGYSTRATTLDVWSQEPTADVFDQMNLQNMGVDSAPGAMEEGRIDAAIAYGTPGVRYTGWVREYASRVDAAIAYGTPGVRYTGWVREYASRVDVHYVEPTDALVESAESYGGAGTSRTAYDDWSMDQDIGTDEVFTWDLQVNYTFNPAASNDAVYELCRVVNEHNETVNEAEEQFNDFESVSDMHASAIERLPVHPGAAQYYQENDAWNDDLQIGD